MSGCPEREPCLRFRSGGRSWPFARTVQEEGGPALRSDARLAAGHLIASLQRSKGRNLGYSRQNSGCLSKPLEGFIPNVAIVAYAVSSHTRIIIRLCRHINLEFGRTCRGEPAVVSISWTPPWLRRPLGASLRVVHGQEIQRNVLQADRPVTSAMMAGAMPLSRIRRAISSRSLSALPVAASVAYASPSSRIRAVPLAP